MRDNSGPGPPAPSIMAPMGDPIDGEMERRGVGMEEYLKRKWFDNRLNMIILLQYMHLFELPCRFIEGIEDGSWM
jgi:hypothetical protein